ncbi:MAG: hypothetical protein CVU54_15885 [Deltaproteobacteria bacterium HGW-Deltaproteobacteria-12]|jgi:hypothetical protein|nr:MAG: hypothetical protein CVU54_15885 [Deltaproteobacteria bacterium HGW-Deltaproteobacteria-12]
MSDFKERAKREDARNGSTGANIPSAESRQLLPVIIALDRIRMNIQMYPPGHSLIAESSADAFETIQRILRQKAELFIGFAQDKTTFGETAPDKEKKNAAFREYARSLNNLQIVSFTLHRGLKKEELIDFHRILAAKPADIWAQGKIESVFTRAGIAGIKVKAIDADQFSSERKKEVLPPKSDQKAKNIDFWQDFFAQTIAAAEKQGAESIPTNQLKTVPAESVRLLNQQRNNWPAAVLSYEKMVKDFFSETPKERQLGGSRHETLSRINSLIADVHPELKAQMIDVVERQLTLLPPAAIDNEFLKYFSSDIVLEVIRGADQKGSPISPTLVNLLKKITGVQDASPAPLPAGEEELSSKHAETLLQREQYEKYVPKDYDRLLQKAAGTSAYDEKIDRSVFPLQEYLQTLSGEYVDFRICRLIFILMDEELDADDYLACSRKLLRSVPDLLQAGHFDFLTSVLETMRRHAREKNAEAVRQSALVVLQSLSDKEKIARPVSQFILQETFDINVLKKFLIESGFQNLSWLFDLYLSPNVPWSTILTAILKGFGQKATEEAVQRLPGQEPQNIIRLLIFIREMNDRSFAPALASIFEHADWTVRRELIKTLIQLDDPSVIQLLRRSLQDENHAVVLETVGISCRYRLEDMITDLTSLLKTRIIREENAILNEWIVTQLAQTGHPLVIPHLEKIAARWVSFSPKHLARMKLALYRNLHHFPKNSVLQLLKKGNRSGNQEIRAISAKILQGKE